MTGEEENANQPTDGEAKPEAGEEKPKEEESPKPEVGAKGSEEKPAEDDDGNEEKPSNDSDEGDNEKEGGSDEDDGKEEKPSAGITAEDRERYTKEITEGGKLSDDSIAEIEKATGFDRETIEAYVEGQKAQAELAERNRADQHKELYDHVGGREEYGNLMKWAEEAAPEAAKAYLGSSDMASAKLALAGLHAMYAKSNPSSPKLHRGGSPSTASDTFKDDNEYTDAINDPRYSQSEAYRREVAAKAARSPIFKQ